MAHPRTEPSPTTLAVVDLGSNSFRLELGRVEGDQIFRLDTWRETLRLGAGLDDLGRIAPHAQRAALACLARFSERLRGLHPSAVRAVATNTFRVAANAGEFLASAEATLGFPIDIISGHEEARLIYLGVAHVLPPSREPRLVIDIGGGSTEFIIGRGLEPERLESLKMGCVSYTRRFFPDGHLRADAFLAAETDARAEVEAIAREFGRQHWREAYASSGTALALAEILEQNGLSSGGITLQGLQRLRKRMVGAGNLRRLRLAGLKPERAPVLAGGLAIMAAALALLDVPRINPVGGAMRLGVLYDLLGRTVRKDIRVATVERFIERYHIDRAHAARVAALAKGLYLKSVAKPRPDSAQRLEWAGLLHEIGYTVSHLGFHKHGAYILENADMPGFSAQEQRRLAHLVLGCRGGLAKMAPLLPDADMRAQLLALRLAVLFHHARGPIVQPRVALSVDRAIRVGVSARWRRAHPLSSYLLDHERDEWRALGYPWKAAR
ncbi:MAG TPA: Ppx/GppA phosphatase family protein [Casimicrobiaceae bacterium]|nr:Ppx/GppA phosphatase family protein [Casimicrobiaceae bacterium]